MSAPMKKRPISSIEVRVEGRLRRYEGIPKSKVKPILTLLKGYEDESVEWRELSKNRISKAGGETAYMVKSARLAADLTQAALAEKLDMPQGNLSQIETGKRTVGKTLAKRLGKVLNMDYRVFL